jgi:hypothetical protein
MHFRGVDLPASHSLLLLDHQEQKPFIDDIVQYKRQKSTIYSHSTSILDLCLPPMLIISNHIQTRDPKARFLKWLPLTKLCAGFPFPLHIRIDDHALRRH